MSMFGGACIGRLCAPGTGLHAVVPLVTTGHLFCTSCANSSVQVHLHTTQLHVTRLLCTGTSPLLHG
jgi:hypothetical protein